MTESSGIFTFPSTGYWLVSYRAVVGNISAGTEDRVGLDLEATQDNSNYVKLCAPDTAVDGSASGGYGMLSAETIIDVENTSNVKVRFVTRSLQAGSTVTGDSNQSNTSFTFIRLGDT